MAEICDYAICFWDAKSRGTKSMIDFVKKYNKPVKIKFISISENVQLKGLERNPKSFIFSHIP